LRENNAHDWERKFRPWKHASEIVDPCIWRDPPRTMACCCGGVGSLDEEIKGDVDAADEDEPGLGPDDGDSGAILEEISDDGGDGMEKNRRMNVSAFCQ
jgi:hypothetical protein